MITRRNLRSWLAIPILAIAIPTAALAEAGDDNPTGVAGAFNGQITTGSSYDPYTGNMRRILTVAMVDDRDALNVLNFRQFLIEMSPVSPTLTQGLNTALATGAFRAQYLGAPVPLRCGGIGGTCRVSLGIGRTVLH